MINEYNNDNSIIQRLLELAQNEEEKSWIENNWWPKHGKKWKEADFPFEEIKEQLRISLKERREETEETTIKKEKETKNPSTNRLLFYLCDICEAEKNGKPTKLYVDVPYLPHIKKNQLINVCPECRKQVQIVNPSELEEDKDWEII